MRPRVDLNACDRRGTVVLLIDNPKFRGYWRGMNRLLLKAIFFGNHIQAP